MFKITILYKIRSKGLQWFFKRLVQEIQQPQDRYKVLTRPLSILLNSPLRIYNSIVCKTSIKKDDRTLYFFYDFDVQPITFDLVSTLCAVNLKRKQLGLDNLHVIFVAGSHKGLRAEDEYYEKVTDITKRQSRVYNLLLPMVYLLDCEKTVTYCSNRTEAHRIFKNTIHVFPHKYTPTFPLPHSMKEVHENGPEIQALRAPTDAFLYIEQWLETIRLNKRKLIVITIRQYKYMPDRNSNVSAWGKFADSLDKEKYCVVFLPDTEISLEPLPEEIKQHHVFLPACWNLILRMALYEKAHLNLMINNGPFSLCFMNTRCRYIIFKICTESVPQSSKKYLESYGFIYGQTPPFALEYQRWVWEDDDLEVIQREFKKIEKDYSPIDYSPHTVSGSVL